MSWQAEAWVQAHPKIKTQGEFCVMVNLANWVNDQGYWSPTYETWAAASRCSVSTLRRTIARLQAAGLILVESRGPNRPNRYHILMTPVTLPDLIPDDLPSQIEQARPVDNGDLPSQIEQAAPNLPIQFEQLPVHPGRTAACSPRVNSEQSLQPVLTSVRETITSWQPDASARHALAERMRARIAHDTAMRRALNAEVR